MDGRTRGESSQRTGHVAASSALLICVLAVAICAIPPTQASAADEVGLNSAATSTQVTQASQAGAYLTGAVLASGEDADEANPLHFPRPRVMALIGVGLLVIGVFLRRREGRKGV